MTRIAIVGAGPKALMALRALDAGLSSRSDIQLSVDLYDPHAPGSGRVWDPSQPAHLLMNVDPQIVDFTSPCVALNFRQWEHAHAHEYGFTPGVTFPARALVGHYLQWVYRALAESERLNITHLANRVTGISAGPGSWTIVIPDSTPRSYHEVLIATGHAASRSGLVGPDHRRLMDPSGPVTSASHVAVIGAALTGLDVVRTLVDGRPDHVPRRITLVSRGGVLMYPKPVTVDPSTITAVRAVTCHLEPYDHDPSGWWDGLIGAAMAAARASGRRVDADQAIRALDQIADPGSLESQWRRSLARAVGDVDDDAAWWLGRAWSAGYADVVRTVERRPRDDVWWPLWRERAQRLERWAFGPPASTIAQMLTLVDQGLLFLAREVPADAVRVEAFIEPAGARSQLLQNMIASGIAHVRDRERGIFTRPDATCVDASGRTLDGLAVVGRPTEDPVIGHDTLSSTLHHDINRWAARLIEQLTATSKAHSQQTRTATVRTP